MALQTVEISDDFNRPDYTPLISSSSGHSYGFFDALAGLEGPDPANDYVINGGAHRKLTRPALFRTPTPDVTVEGSPFWGAHDGSRYDGRRTGLAFRMDSSQVTSGAWRGWIANADFVELHHVHNSSLRIYTYGYDTVQPNDGSWFDLGQPDPPTRFRFGNGMRMRAVTSGDLIRVYADDQLVFTRTDTRTATATEHGFWCSSTSLDPAPGAGMDNVRLSYTVDAPEPTTGHDINYTYRYNMGTANAGRQALFTRGR